MATYAWGAGDWACRKLAGLLPGKRGPKGPSKLTPRVTARIRELAAGGLPQAEIGRQHAARHPDELGFLYIDGHTRAYFGTRDVQKMHLARMKHSGPGTEETWVTGSRSDPMLVVIAEPSASLAIQIKGLLPHLRAVCGEDTTPVLCLDRGGWSPDLFADIIAARDYRPA